MAGVDLIYSVDPSDKARCVPPGYHAHGVFQLKCLQCRGYELLAAAALAGNSRASEMLAYGYIVSLVVMGYYIIFTQLISWLRSTFQFGSYLTRNFTKAFEIFSELAEKGSPIGQQVMCVCVCVCVCARTRH